MPPVFLNTSAFIKLYHQEKGSTWLNSFIIGKTLIISELVLAKSASTLGRLYRDGIYTKRQSSLLYAQIYRDLKNYQLIPLGTKSQLNKFVSLAFNLPPGLRLRTLDGLHLAAAELARDSAQNQNPPQTLTFVSADIRLLAIGQVQGFVVENPENYP